MAIDLQIEQSLLACLHGKLDSDERFIWTGRPRVWFTMTWTDLFGRSPLALLLFAPLWLPLAIAADGRQPSIPPFVGLLVLAVIIAGRYAVEVYIRKGTVYGLTTSRAMTLRPLGPQRFRWADVYGPKSFTRGILRGGTIHFQADMDNSADLGRSAPFMFGLRSASLSSGVWFDGVDDAVQLMTAMGAPP